MEGGRLGGACMFHTPQYYLNSIHEPINFGCVKYANLNAYGPIFSSFFFPLFGPFINKMVLITYKGHITIQRYFAS